MGGGSGGALDGAEGGVADGGVEGLDAARVVLLGEIGGGLERVVGGGEGGDEDRCGGVAIAGVDEHAGGGEAHRELGVGGELAGEREGGRLADGAHGEVRGA